MIGIIRKSKKNSGLVSVQIKEAITNSIAIKKLPCEGGKLPCPL